MDQEDPITQFFPGNESVDLYDVLSVKHDAKPEDIRKAYRKLALLCHPDKHASSSDDAKIEASRKFQQVGYAYAVLGDEKRRQKYDRTGRTDEAFDATVGEDGWEAYFEDLFERVTRGKLDEMKKEYQHSQQEVDDLRQAYMDTEGSIGDIMNHVPHSTNEDEARFIVTISNLISDGELPSLPTWQSSIKDEKAKLVRKKQAVKEADEAEALAKELGIWDEFYGSGKPGERRSKGKTKGKKDEGDGEDHSALQALILKRQQRKEKNIDGFFDSLAAKYAEPKGKGKKRAVQEADSELPRKKSRKADTAPPEIDDEEFAKLQQKLFGGKPPSQDMKINKGKGRKTKIK